MIQLHNTEPDAFYDEGDSMEYIIFQKDKWSEEMRVIRMFSLICY